MYELLVSCSFEVVPHLVEGFDVGVDLLEDSVDVGGVDSNMQQVSRSFDACQRGPA